MFFKSLLKIISKIPFDSKEIFCKIFWKPLSVTTNNQTTTLFFVIKMFLRYSFNIRIHFPLRIFYIPRSLYISLIKFVSFSFSLSVSDVIFEVMLNKSINNDEWEILCANGNKITKSSTIVLGHKLFSMIFHLA